MKKIRKYIYGAVFALSANVVLADQQRSNIDYAPSEAPNTKQVAVPLPITPSEINVVSGNLGDYQKYFNNDFFNHMCLWLTAKKDGACHISWELNVPEAGEYEVSSLAAGAGSRLSLTLNGKPQNKVVELTATKSLGWARESMGTVKLKAGINRLHLNVTASKDFRFDALEIVKPEVKEAQYKEAMAMRYQPDWFKNAGYGLMFQWTNRATPPTGDIKPWEQKVEDFDLDGFVKLVEESGAAYVLWSVTWGQQYISAPLKSLDAIIPGRTTKRDLLGEMADALDELGVKLIFYYHYGYDCNHSVDKEWMEASGGYSADKTEFYNNFKAVVGEMGERYGDKLHGWWFDGGQRFYNCHFDNSQGDQGILSAPFKELTLTSRKGNKERVIAYNSWIKPRLTEYQDYYGGEGGRSFSNLENGLFPDGPKKGLQAHGCFILEREWGHIKKDTPIPAPKFDIDKMAGMIEKALKKQYPLSINLEMYEDGSVSPESAQLLRALKAKVR